MKRETKMVERLCPGLRGPDPCNFHAQRGTVGKANAAPPLVGPQRSNQRNEWSFAWDTFFSPMAPATGQYRPAATDRLPQAANLSLQPVQ